MEPTPRPARIAELIADSLRRKILRGELTEGLPKEDILREQFGVAKSSMREALLILRTEGLITVRRGNQGGSTVHRPDAATAAYSTGLALTAAGTTMNDVALTLQIVEPACAVSCAQRADRNDELVPALRAYNQRLSDNIEDGLEVVHISREFHQAMVQGSQNPALASVAAMLGCLWTANEVSWATRATIAGAFPDMDERRHGDAFHRRITDAISVGDEGVGELVRQHLVESQAYLLDHHGEDLVDVATLRSISSY